MTVDPQQLARTIRDQCEWLREWNAEIGHSEEVARTIARIERSADALVGCLPPGSLSAVRVESGEASRQLPLLLANIEIAHDRGRGAIRSGEAPLDVLDRTLDRIVGFVSGRMAMIVPKHMIDPDDLARAIGRGQELAAEHGWTRATTTTENQSSPESESMGMRPAHERLLLLAEHFEADKRRRGRVAAFDVRDIRDAAAELVSLRARVAAALYPERFWRRRYDTQHGTVHRLEDALAEARARVAELEAALRCAET